MSESVIPGRHIETLPNGLTILLQEIRQYPVVLFDVWIRAGLRDERDNEWGLSHFLEHMMFTGNENVTRDDFTQSLYRIGGDDNAGTWEDVTDYYILVTSDHFNRGLELHSSLLSEPLLDEDEFNKEREVVIEEIHIYEDDPEATISEKTENIIYKNTGYDHPILGTVDSLRVMTPDLMRDYYRRHYVPHKMLVTIVGDFDTAEVLPVIREKYSKIQGDPKSVSRESPEVPFEGPEIHIRSSDIDSTYIAICFKGPPLRSMDTYALDILMEALGGCRSARLNSRLFEELNLVTDIEAYNMSYMDAATISIDVELTETDNIQASLDEIFTILIDTIAHELDEGEIERAKTRMMADRVFKNEDSMGISNFYGSNISLGSLEIAEKYLDRLASVTSGQILDVARRYIRPGNMAIGIHHPEKAGKVEISLEKFVPGAHEPVHPALPHGRITTGIERSRDHTGNLGPVVREELPNGAVFYYQNNPLNPCAAVHVYIRGGLVFETWDTNGISEVMQRALHKGTQYKSATELNLAIDALGASVDADTGRDFHAFTTLFLSRDFDIGSRLAAEMLLEPAYSEDEIEKVKDEVKGAIIQSQDEMDDVCFERLRLDVYGKDHPYGRPYLGRLESVDKLNAKQIREFHKRIYTPENLVISIVGDIDENKAREFVHEKFGSLERTGLQLPPIKPPRNVDTEKILKLSRDKSQVRLAIGRPAPTMPHPDFPVLVLLDAVLGGSSYSRLFEVLRERDGLAYDAYSDILGGRYEGIFHSYLGTAPENYQDAIDGIKSEYKRMIEEGPGEEEMSNARNWLKGHTLIWRQGNEELAERMGIHECLDLPHDFDLRLLAAVKTVTAGDINRIAKEILDPDRQVISICGPIDV